MNARRWLIAILITCAAAGLHQGAVHAAQTGASELHGIIRDDTGAATPGALVTLIDERREIYTTVADSEGAYVFRGLRPGTYDLNVMLAGFAPVTQRVVMTGQSRAGVDVKLRVALAERVNVVSSFEDFRRATGLSPVGMTLGPEQLGILPNDPDSMLMVLRELSATTGRADQVKVYVDGQPMTARLPPKEAIQSIRISTNSFASEFAEPSAGLVEIITKPATTNFRGDWQATFNDSALNARNFFEPEKRPSRTQAYSGYLAGPIVPGRWSFLAYGGRWMRDERLIVNTTVVNPATFAVEPFVHSVETPNRIESYSFRTDVSATPAHLLSAEYVRLRESHDNAGLESGLDLPERAVNRDLEDNTARLSLVSVLGPGVGSELRMQVRSRTARDAALTTTPAILVLDTFNTGGNQPSLGLDRTTREASFSEVISYIEEPHTLRVGVNGDVVRHHEVRQSNLGGTYTFGASVDPNGMIIATPIERYQRTLQNIPGYGPSTFTITRGAPPIDFTDWHASWFAQDDLRPSPNVTISAGLRHDMQRQAREWWFDLAPRAGVAWTPDGGGRHTLRAALGIFYQRIPADMALDALRYSGLGVVDLVVDQPTFFPTVPPAFDATAVLPTVRSTGPVRAPRTAAATTSYEWQITNTVFGSISFTKQRGDRLLRSRNVNAPSPITGERPQLDLGPILQFESTGRSDTEQLRVTLRRVLTRVSLFGTYVFGRARSDTDGPYTVPADSHTLQGEYGRAADDERHSLVLGGVLNFPREWGISGLLTVGSGRPFNITTGSDENHDLLFLDRPGAASPGDPGAIPTGFGSFDPLRGLDEPMIVRNAGQGPSQLVLSLGLAKTVRLGSVNATSRPYVIFGVNAENASNHVNFTDFNGVVTSPLFGQANRALNPRRIEMSVRFGF